MQRNKLKFRKLPPILNANAWCPDVLPIFFFFFFFYILLKKKLISQFRDKSGDPNLWKFIFSVIFWKLICFDEKVWRKIKKKKLNKKIMYCFFCDFFEEKFRRVWRFLSLLPENSFFYLFDQIFFLCKFLLTFI